jgi:homoprotocatechuate degradation regulator HpaR
LKPTHRNLPLLLLHAREAALAHFRPILKRFGLTDQQWRILRVLSEARNGLEPGQIAEACKIQKPSLTGILTRMTETKLIEREVSEHDQRKQRISLSTKGIAVVDRVTPLIDLQYQRIETMVGVETLTDTYRTLDAMLALLSRSDSSAVDHGAKLRSKRRRGADYGTPRA